MDVIIVPEPGQQTAIAKLLFQLADSPAQVRYVSRPESGFEVPEELFVKFEAAYVPHTSDVEELSTGDSDTTSEVTVPKKRGRPRKKQDDEEK